MPLQDDLSGLTNNSSYQKNQVAMSQQGQVKCQTSQTWEILLIMKWH